MHVALIHGYLLGGTGSNLYVRNFCRELCEEGHRVTLICQESNWSNYDFIETGYVTDGELLNELYRTETSYPGKCRAVRPDINGLLPVYVWDKYDGYTVKEFQHLSEEELQDYLRRNLLALEAAFAYDNPDLIISNHLIMQPVIVERYRENNPGPRHVLLVHGSALNFSVRKSPRLKEMALGALQGVEQVVFNSRFSRQEFLDFFDMNGADNWYGLVVPGGVNLDQFLPILNSTERHRAATGLLSEIKNASYRSGGRSKSDYDELVTQLNGIENLSDSDSFIREIGNGSCKTIDAGLEDELAQINWEGERLVLYYGKFLWTKGVHLLLLAAPLILKRYPRTRFILVGFGSGRGYLEALLAALDRGDYRQLLLLLEQPEHFQNNVIPETLEYHRAFCDRLRCDAKYREEYIQQARGKLARQVLFTGYLGHKPLSRLIPLCTVTVAPSIFPESFGLVAVEALACGLIPLQTNHSGFAEVYESYKKQLLERTGLEGLRDLNLNDSLVFNISNNVQTLFSYYDRLNQSQRISLKSEARSIALSNYSWEAVARRFLKA